MKKILILNPYLPTLGGGEKYMGFLCQFIENYFNNNVKIDILVFNYNDIDIFSDTYVTIEKLNLQYDLHLKNTYLRKENFVERDNQEEIIADISGEYDLFINFMIFSRQIPRAKKNVYLCMFPPKSWSMECGKRLKNKILARIKDRQFIKAYDKFVIICEYSNHWFFNYWKTVRKSNIIYSPVFSEKDLTGRYDEKKKKNIIVSVGRFFVAAHSKKQLEMVQFFVGHQEIFKDYEYHLVGAVSNYVQDQEYLAKIKILASQVSNIYIHENCPYEELMKLYESAKIFWHATGYGIDENSEPEKMEHFGITTVEAMSFGVVPVVIRKGGQRETVKEGENGFLWNTEEECIQKTNLLIDDDDLRKKMAVVSAERAKDFSIEKFYKENRRVFDELQI